LYAEITTVTEQQISAKKELSLKKRTIKRTKIPRFLLQEMHCAHLKLLYLKGTEKSKLQGKGESSF
jgi:hypothetical protein